MPDSIRTFVAVKVPVLPTLRSVLSTLTAMHWPVVAVSPDEMHVTLKFLGDTPNELLDEIREQVALAVTGQSPFVLRVEGVGAFPNADRPSVLWARLEPAKPLVVIAERLAAALEPFGFARESRPFHPHLTLARIKDRPPHELFALMKHHAETSFGRAEIHAVELLRSDPQQRDGSRYTVLSSCELQ